MKSEISRESYFFLSNVGFFNYEKFHFVEELTWAPGEKTNLATEADFREEGGRKICGSREG